MKKIILGISLSAAILLASNQYEYNTPRKTTEKIMIK